MSITFSRVFLFIWGACQIIISWQLLVFFMLPNQSIGGEEVVWIAGTAIQVYKWSLHLPGASMNFQTLVFIAAGIYLLIGVMQTLPLPKEARWRGTWVANTLTSLSVSGLMVWTWARLIWDPHYQITLMQQQVFWAFLTVSVADTLLFDAVIPVIRRIARKVAVAPAAAGP